MESCWSLLPACKVQCVIYSACLIAQVPMCIRELFSDIHDPQMNSCGFCDPLFYLIITKFGTCVYVHMNGLGLNEMSPNNGLSFNLLQK